MHINLFGKHCNNKKSVFVWTNLVLSLTHALDPSVLDLTLLSSYHQKVLILKSHCCESSILEHHYKNAKNQFG